MTAKPPPPSRERPRERGRILNQGQITTPSGGHIYRRRFELLSAYLAKDAAGGNIVMGRSESITVKGRKTPVELFEVLAVKGEES